MLFYPPGMASAVVLLIIVTFIVSFILRVVDVRKELTGERAHASRIMIAHAKAG